MKLYKTYRFGNGLTHDAELLYEGTEDECRRVMRQNMDPTQKIYYIRSTVQKNIKYIDYGSWSTFFALVYED